MQLTYKEFVFRTYKELLQSNETEIKRSNRREVNKYMYSWGIEKSIRDGNWTH